jgi:hypothetical protein
MYPVPKKAKNLDLFNSSFFFFLNWKLSSIFECSWFQKSKPFTIQFLLTVPKPSILTLQTNYPETLFVSSLLQKPVKAYYNILSPSLLKTTL